MEGKLCDLCRRKVHERNEDWPDWNLKNILGVRDLCGKCRSQFRKIIKEFKASRKKKQ